MVNSRFYLIKLFNENVILLFNDNNKEYKYAWNPGMVKYSKYVYLLVFIPLTDALIQSNGTTALYSGPLLQLFFSY